MSATPRRRFWLLCALVLPIANVPVIAAFFAWLAIVSAQCPAGGYECPFFSRRGLTRRRRGAWLAAGAAFVFVQTCLYSVVALVVLVLVGLNDCGLLESGCT